MENYREILKKQLEELEELQKTTKKELSKVKNAPEGHIHISESNGVYQYYYVADGKRKYIKKKEMNQARKIAQRDYDNEFLQMTEILHGRLDRFISSYDIGVLNELYIHKSEARKQLITPLIKLDEDYIEEWRGMHPAAQNTFDIASSFITNRGERVRSKSEKIIADTLDRYGIPYQYEPLLELKGYHTVYPDFVVLNVRTRKTFYWEHLGIISDLEYATKNFKKIEEYEDSGYLLGKNLIITTESDRRQLDVSLVEEKIKAFLL
ncbi:hypothetical protein [Pseudobutyrivibrio sp.]|uniref:hypothetical protein n=1 Tax=Pseudobutyrivibrio sp. TaxID=2014367 RepID=UPI001DAAA113|nr:hypothetical protein [Pseudobutyrivibrio sp.]MBE5909857.1 hypothetical protein [Pseudobutyrivibrio sp.]